ncbi:probable phospholipase A2 homolog 2 isoform X1 [Phragmites australis]|uniref:probable phospholipase A2 homolog 2 isoform X1 n=1 Tax=Phragmites australis TaxID=29695 RepID=UPI002D768D77|nr:probable phospholipase A2 homolog 2 isoform X1 [Phragmites australis]
MASVLVFSWCSFLLILLLAPASRALNIGDLLGKPPAGSQGCSRTCESSFCTVPPLLRYGKYCGILYSGCPGETPCDALDACCMVHDHCVDTHNRENTKADYARCFTRTGRTKPTKCSRSASRPHARCLRADAPPNTIGSDSQSSSSTELPDNINLN